MQIMQQRTEKTSAIHFSNVQKMFVLSAVVDCHHFFHTDKTKICRIDFNSEKVNKCGWAANKVIYISIC